MISQIFAALFGGGRNVVADTAEVFRVNAEADAGRAHDLDAAALAQMAAEFQYRGRRGWFDRFMDGLNRLPRPALVVGLVWLLAATVRDPARMAEVFEAWAILPAEIWVIFGIVVTFYFGGRHQAKELEMSRSLAEAAGAARALSARRADLSPGAAPVEQVQSENPALDAWRKKGA